MDLMARHMMLMMAFGGKDMRLINQHTITQDYTTTLSPLYTAEIAPFITFGDYHKLCVVLFENNTTTLSNAINCVYFSLGIEPDSMTTNTRNGGMIRGNYMNIRNLITSNDARCSAGTIIKIYEIGV